MEPVSTSGLTAILKFYGAAIMVTLAVGLVAAVVLMTRMPRSPQEWGSGLDLYGCIKSCWRLIHYREMGAS